MIPLKTDNEIELMGVAGSKLAEVIVKIVGEVNDGLNNTLEINELADRLIKEADAEPAFKGYRDYPASVCISVNSEVVHGIPAREKFLNPGDLVSLDLGLRYNGFFADSAESFIYGGTKNNKEGQKLIESAIKGFEAGLEAAVAGNHVNDIGKRVQETVEKDGYGVVRDLVGHGIGRELHEEPAVPNYSSQSDTPRLANGMVLAIEPMITQGDYKVFTHSDGWTVETANKQLAAHVEHTVAITAKGPIVLTAR
jgi:methionyl aminopeptidase